MAVNKYGKKLIAWKFPETAETNRSRRWYLTAGLFSLLVLIYAFFTANPLLILLVLILAVVLFLLANETPREIEFAVYEDGVRIGSRFYYYREIKNFYVIYQPPLVKNLYFHFQSLTQPRTRIPLLNYNPIKVREYLLDYLTEDLSQEEEPFSDWFGRVLKL